MEKRSLSVQFIIDGPNIETKMHNQNVTPQETIGLLEMAKTQILDNLKQRRKEIFKSVKKNE